MILSYLKGLNLLDAALNQQRLTVLKAKPFNKSANNFSTVTLKFAITDFIVHLSTIDHSTDLIQE